MRAHPGGVRQFPRARGESEVLTGQRADGAEVDRVAREARLLYRLLQGGLDDAVPAAFMELEDLFGGPLREEASTTVADDAALLIEHDGGADAPCFVLVQARLREELATGAAQHRHFLEFALAALVADGAVERVIGEDELNNVRSPLEHLLGIGDDLHALGAFQGAGGLQGRHLSVDGLARLIVRHRLACRAIDNGVECLDQAYAAGAEHG